ncbi:MAG: hypothetical protein ACI3ZL_01670 [Candidatus Cryptobacteroides sp.]
MSSLSGKIRLAATLAVLSAATILGGCSSVDTVVSYVPVSKADSLGRLQVGLDLSDTTASYDISLYSRLDCSVKDFSRLKEFPVGIEFVSPSGNIYSETVYVPLDSFEINDGTVHDFCAPYRTGAVPVEGGEWTMYLSLPDIPGLYGMGVILKTNHQ